jgi:tetratricopeptide (TPR) repeat protein
MKPMHSLLLCFLVLAATSLQAQRGRDQALKGTEFYQQEEYEKAIDQYREGLELAPDSPILQFNLGDALYKSDRLEEAIEAFQESSGFENPDIRSKAFYNLGNALFQENRLAESLEAYKQALRINPSDRQAKHNLELVLRQLQQQPQDQDQKQENGEQDSDREQQTEDQSNPEENSEDQEQSESDEQAEELDSPTQQEDQEASNDSSRSEHRENQPPENQDQTSSDAQPEGALSKEEAERLLEALREDQQELLQRRFKGTKRSSAKDW